MKVKRLKEILNNLDDDLDVMIRNSVNICGNISELAQLEKSAYGFFGSEIPCIILNSDVNLKLDEEDNSEEYIEDNK